MTETQTPTKRGPKPAHATCTIDGCDRRHYANGLCRAHDRRIHGRDKAYEASDRAKQRQRAYYLRRTAIAAVTGERNLSTVFSSKQHLGTLRKALKAGDERLVKVWAFLTDSQKAAIEGIKASQ